MEETFNMSKKELERLNTLNLVREKRLTQVVAGKRLGISERQIRKLLRRLEMEGPAGIISKKRGKPSNHRLSAELKSKTLTLINDNYNDFGPKLAIEYLKKYHEISLSTETLRQWMIQAHLWIPGKSRKKTHPPRVRRGSFGELIQADGSHHDWFEGRSSPCVLMVFIDDATSAITHLHFSKEETLNAYYHGLKSHILEYGIPLAFYVDRSAVMVPRTERKVKSPTQFHRALSELNSQLILALSPQAKGRVERVNRTLQDRLVKELRIRGISNIEEANSMLNEFRKEYNNTFSKKPSEQQDAHRPLDGTSLNKILSVCEERILSKDFLVQFKNTFYQISSQDPQVRFFKGAKIELRQCLDGTVHAYFKDQEVVMTSLSKVEYIQTNQPQQWKDKIKYRPSQIHPYKHSFIMKNRENEMRNWYNKESTRTGTF